MGKKSEEEGAGGRKGERIGKKKRERKSKIWDRDGSERERILYGQKLNEIYVITD